MIFSADAFAGRRVLVTGGSRGIGAACCRLFAAGGAWVAVHYHRAEDEARKVLDGLAGAGERDHLAIRADLADRAETAALFGSIEEAWSGLDVLVNNAGIWVRNPLASFDAERLDTTLAVNLTGPILCAVEGLELLRRGVEPSIVNVSSTAGQRGEADYSPYAASKGALIALTKSWAAELAPDVRVNAVAPGWVDTDMSASAYRDGGREKISAGIPVGRIASPEDVAAPVLFLASDAARHLTGEILNVNGGAVLCG